MEYTFLIQALELLAAARLAIPHIPHIFAQIANRQVYASVCIKHAHLVHPQGRRVDALITSIHLPPSGIVANPT